MLLIAYSAAPVGAELLMNRVLSPNKTYAVPFKLQGGGRELAWITKITNNNNDNNNNSNNNFIITKRIPTVIANNIMSVDLSGSHKFTNGSLSYCTHALITR